MRFNLERLGDSISRAMVAFTLMMVAVLLTLAGSGFLAAALYLGLAEIARPASAALGTGVVILAVAVLLLVVARRTTRRPLRVAGPRVGAVAGEPAVMAELGRSLGNEVASWARSHATSAAATALAAGLVFGVSPRLRRALWRLLQ